MSQLGMVLFCCSLRIRLISLVSIAGVTCFCLGSNMCKSRSTHLVLYPEFDPLKVFILDSGWFCSSSSPLGGLWRSPCCDWFAISFRAFLRFTASCSASCPGEVCGEPWAFILLGTSIPHFIEIFRDFDSDDWLRKDYVSFVMEGIMKVTYCSLTYHITGCPFCWHSILGASGSPTHASQSLTTLFEDPAAICEEVRPLPRLNNRMPTSALRTVSMVLPNSCWSSSPVRGSLSPWRVVFLPHYTEITTW